VLLASRAGQQFTGKLTFRSPFHVGMPTTSNKNSSIARPETKYFYPGFQIGGPVILPQHGALTGRDKMFFFLEPSNTSRTFDNGVYHAVVPTPRCGKDFAALAASPPNGSWMPLLHVKCWCKDYTRLPRTAT